MPERPPASDSSDDPARRAGRAYRHWLSAHGVGEKEVDPLLVAPLVAGLVAGVLRDCRETLPGGARLRSDLARLLDRVPNGDGSDASWSDEGVRRRAVSLLPSHGDVPARFWGDRDLFLRLEAVRQPGEPRQSLAVYPLWLIRGEPPLAAAVIGASCIVDAPHRESGSEAEGHERTMALFSDGDAASFARAVLAGYAHVRGARDWGAAYRTGAEAWREAPPEIRSRTDAVARSLAGEDVALPWR